ncbi:MAG: WXG100 family type VII secretion target [Actinomycetaceae bacterium]|nr:WXG100 family type VII secretion target [Actinomycetaceae bacterium]
MRYQVDVTQVSGAATRTRASAAVISEEVAAMMGHLTTLQESWVGQASGAFAACATQWRSAQAQVEAALTNISTQLDIASQTYTEAEMSAASLFAGR